MRFQAVTLCIGTLFAGLIVGCQSDTEIRKEIVSFPDRQKLRTRVAIVQDADFAWFFRLSGPLEDVGKHAATFDVMVKSLNFVEDEDRPLKWDEPKGWRKEPAFGERYAGYRIDAEPKELEVSVTRLPREKFHLLTNVNRWQKQLELPTAEREADLIEQGVVKKDIVGKSIVTWVDLAGHGSHLVSKPPDPRVAGNQKMLMPMVQAKKEAGSPFKTVVPKGWIKKAPNQFAVEAYQIRDGDKLADITISNVGGEISDNINRWRTQVGLKSLKGEELIQTVIKLEIPDQPCLYVDIANAQWQDATKNRILGVVIPRKDGRHWFIKMTGPIEFIGEHKNDFETYVQSFRLKR